jgi:hypothetical protein
MLKKMPDSDKIKDDLKLPAPVIAALIGVADGMIHDLLKEMTKDRCKYAVAISNFTSHNMTLDAQSSKDKNGKFVEAPDDFIPEKSVGGCSSKGGKGVGNKNYITYKLKNAVLLIYWHSALIGSKNYYVDIAEENKFKDWDDKKIINYAKDRQVQKTIHDSHNDYKIVASYAPDNIKISLMTKAQSEK